MTWNAGLALLVAIAAAGCASKSAPQAAAPTEPAGGGSGAAEGGAAGDTVEAAVKGAIEQWRQAYEVRSMDALGKLYVHEPGLTVVQDGSLLSGWAAVEPALRARLARAAEIHVRIKDLQIAALGPGGAVAVGAMTREATSGATSVLETGVITLVLRADPDGWVIASEHYSYRRP